MDKRTGKDEYPDLDLDELDRQIRHFIEPYPFIRGVLLHKGIKTRYHLVFRVGAIQKEQTGLYGEFYETMEGPAAFGPFRLDDVYLQGNPEPLHSAAWYEWPFKDWSWSIARLEGNTVLPDEPVMLFGRDGKNGPSVEVAIAPVASEGSSTIGDENSFTLVGDIWRIRFNGEEGFVQSLDGMKYLTILLEKPGKSISAKELARVVSVKALNEEVKETEAKAQGMNAGFGPQEVNSQYAKEAYFEYLRELQEDLAAAKKLGDIETAEKIESDIDQLVKRASLQKKNFTDSDAKKAANNIGQRINNAIMAIKKAGMINLAEHLDRYTKPAGNYDFSYSGKIEWNIRR